MSYKLSATPLDVRKHTAIVITSVLGCVLLLILLLLPATQSSQHLASTTKAATSLPSELCVDAYSAECKAALAEVLGNIAAAHGYDEYIITRTYSTDAESAEEFRKIRSHGAHVWRAGFNPETHEAWLGWDTAYTEGLTETVHQVHVQFLQINNKFYQR